MAIGDERFNICPVCRADNRYVNMEITMFGKPVQIGQVEATTGYRITCEKCGFGLSNPIYETRKGAIVLWNSHVRLDQTPSN